MKSTILILFILLHLTLFGQKDSLIIEKKNGLIWKREIFRNQTGGIIKTEKYRRIITRRNGTARMKNYFTIIKEINDNGLKTKSYLVEIEGGSVMTKYKYQEYKNRFPALFFKRINNILGLFFIPVNPWWLYRYDEKNKLKN